MALADVCGLSLGQNHAFSGPFQSNTEYAGLPQMNLQGGSFEVPNNFDVSMLFMSKSCSNIHRLWHIVSYSCIVILAMQVFC